MNNIPLLREVVKGVVTLLAERQIKVTQKGIDAYVNYDRETGEPESVNMPNIPDNADEALLLAIKGFVDHEVGHILDTDGEEYTAAFREWESLGQEPSQVLFLKSLHNTIEDVFIESRQVQRFRGVSYNYDNVYHFLLDTHTNPSLLEDDGVTAESKLLFAIVRAWGGQQQFVNYMSDKWDLVDTFVSKIPQNLRDQIPQCQSTADTRTLTRTIFDYVQSIEQQKSSQESDQEGEDQSDENHSQLDSSTGDDVSGEETKSQEVNSALRDFDTAVGNAISQYIKGLVDKDTHNYLLYSTDQDFYGKYQGQLAGNIHTEVEHLIGSLARNFERVLQVQGLERWNSGQRRGRFDRRSASRLAASNKHQELHTENIYRTKDVTKTKDMAISVLVDCSRSMVNADILRKAFITAYGIVATLDHLGISNELVGFTTKISHEAFVYQQEVEEAEGKDGIEYARHIPLYIPTFKSFDERNHSSVTGRIEHYLMHGETGATVLGEPVQDASYRIQKRPESGKLIIVITDGKPECPGNASMRHHAKKAISEVEQSKGIDILGIGLGVHLDSLFTDFTYIDSVKELPSALLSKLKAFTFKQLSVR